MRVVKPDEVQVTPETTASVENAVKEIITSVREKGDRALYEYNEKFDSYTGPFRVSTSDFHIEDELLNAIKHGIENVRRFAEMELKSSGSWLSVDNGKTLGVHIKPVKSVAVYAPGGRAAYPSSVYMAAIPAMVAGVERLYITTPPPRKPEVLEVMKATAHLCGVDTLYLIGGAQAVAAFAYGTETVPKVDMVVGPGNMYVAEAKRQLFGVIGIDSIAGPSEVAVVDDGSAPVEYAVYDLMAQAEHDPNARVYYLSKRSRVDEVIRALESEIPTAPRAEIIKRSMENALFVPVETMKDALETVNRLAPEHLELLVSEPFSYLPDIRNAGAIFLGVGTPVALGDYIAGPSHILPTGGTARFSSPLSVWTFLKRMSVIHYSSSALKEDGKHAVKLASFEGLPNHAESVKRRL